MATLNMMGYFKLFVVCLRPGLLGSGSTIFINAKQLKCKIANTLLAKKRQKLS
jgi:hypothetical protein